MLNKPDYPIYTGFQKMSMSDVSSEILRVKSNGGGECPDGCPEAISVLFEHPDLARIAEKWDGLPPSVRLGMLAIVEGI